MTPHPKDLQSLSPEQKRALAELGYDWHEIDEMEKTLEPWVVAARVELRQTVNDFCTERAAAALGVLRRRTSLLNSTVA